MVSLLPCATLEGMTSHLVREVRTNKNGVPVTKLVRPQGSSGIRTSVPAPSLGASKDKNEHEVLGLDICNRITERLGSKTPFGYGNIDKVNELPNDRRRALMEIVESCDKENLKLISQAVQYDGSHRLNIVISIQDFAMKVEKTKNPNAASNRAHLSISSIVSSEYHRDYELEELDEERIAELKSKYLTRAMGVRDSVAISEMLDPDDYALELSESLDILEPALPAILVLEKVKNRIPSTSTVLEVAELVSEYPGREQEIADIIVSRRSYDIEMLQDVLNNDNLALAEGVL